MNNDGITTFEGVTPSFFYLFNRLIFNGLWGGVILISERNICPSPLRTGSAVGIFFITYFINH